MYVTSFQGLYQMKPPGGFAADSRRGAEGFTLLELTIVVTLAGLTLAAAGLSFGDYFRRASAQRAAKVFAQDLTLARSTAVRTREPVVIRFNETSMWYEVEVQSLGEELVRRRFSGASSDIDLSAIGLDFSGDTVVFNIRGIADLSEAAGALGTATFSSGSTTYTVSFNSMGASKVE